MKKFLKNIFFTSSNSEKMEIRYLKNTFSYLKLLKENNEKEVPKHKLELATILNEMDIFLLKTRLIFSFLGVLGSLIIVLLALNNYVLSSFDYNIRFQQLIAFFLYIYISGIVFLISYRSLRRALSDLNMLKSQIE